MALRSVARLVGRRILVVLTSGVEERLACAAAEAAERGHGRVTLVSPHIAQRVFVTLVPGCEVLAVPPDARPDMMRTALEVIPPEIPVMTLTYSGSLRGALERLLADEPHDLGIVATAKHAATLRAAGVAVHRVEPTPWRVRLRLQR